MLQSWSTTNSINVVTGLMLGLMSYIWVSFWSGSHESTSSFDTNIRKSITKPAKLTFLDKPLFGQSLQDDIMPTTLQAEIIGILYHQSPDKSLVTLKLLNGTEDTYKVGDKVMGAKILEILPNEVIIRHLGKKQRIVLQSDKLTFEPVSSTLFERPQ